MKWWLDSWALLLWSESIAVVVWVNGVLLEMNCGFAWRVMWCNCMVVGWHGVVEGWVGGCTRGEVEVVDNGFPPCRLVVGSVVEVTHNDFKSQRLMVFGPSVVGLSGGGRVTGEHSEAG